jgi:tetratricopeptide (TPR) repeat protein
MAVSIPRVIAVCLVLLAPPSKAGDAPTGWTEVRTEHITLKSDLGKAEAERAALAVESTRSALLAAAWPGAKLFEHERVEVVDFASQPDFLRYFGANVIGLFLHGDYPPTAFLFGPPEKWEKRATVALAETTSVLKHELSHHLSAYFYRRQPKWFAEGLAQYLETLRIAEDGKSATLGEVNLVAMAKHNRFPQKVANVLAWSGKLDTKDETQVLGLYGTSWLLVHWLNNVHPEEFARYQTFLAKGIDPDKAWKAAFPNLSTTDIDVLLYQYVHHGDYHYFVVPIPPVEGTLSSRPVASAEVHATRAAAALAGAVTLAHGTTQLADAQSELRAALADDPGNVRALRMSMGVAKPEQRLAIGRRATAAHPEDGLAWLTLAENLPTTPEGWDERAQAYQKATALLPDNPTAFNNLAWMYVLKGQPQEALPLALTAVRMAPWDANILDTLAGALAGLHRCSEAVAMESRAVDTLSERTVASRRAEFVGRLVQFQEKCSEAAAQAPSSAAPPSSSQP